MKFTLQLRQQMVIPTGIKPEDMFRDQEEADEASMREIYESLKKK